MNPKRRDTLRLMAVIGLMASTGLISQAQAAEWNKAAFEGKSLDDVLKSPGLRSRWSGVFYLSRKGRCGSNRSRQSAACHTAEQHSS